MSAIEQIKAEIERRIKEIKPQNGQGVVLCDQITKQLQSLLSFINSLPQEKPEVELFECPKTPIKDAIEVTSRMKYIDEELKPIAEFIMDYASWNLHKSEWNQPTIEVPLFRALDALIQKGKPYCGA